MVALAVLLGAGTAVAVLVAIGARPSTTVGAPVGASNEGYAVWARNDDGTPVRWDPCSTVRVVVSGAGGPATYPEDALVRDVERAVATLREATALDLRLTGTTDEIPDADRSTLAMDGAGWAPVLVGWREPGSGGLPMRDVDRAVAVPVAVGPRSDRVYVTGQVALNPAREDLLPGGADRATSWGATVLHELAHVLGLAHVDDPDELLHTYPGSGPVELGPGDRAGLAAVGAGGPCLEVPEPRELDVEVPSG